MQSSSEASASTEIATPTELVPIIELLNCRFGTHCVTCLTVPSQDTAFVGAGFLAQLSVIPLCDNADPFDIQFWKAPSGSVVAMQNTCPKSLIRYDLTLTAELLRLTADIAYRLSASHEFAYVSAAV